MSGKRVNKYRSGTRIRLIDEKCHDDDDGDDDNGNGDDNVNDDDVDIDDDYDGNDILTKTFQGLTMT